MKYFNIFTIATILGAMLLFSSAPFAQGNAVDADEFLGGSGGNSAAVQSPVKTPENKELSDIEKSIAAAKAELEDEGILKKKIALAQEMHKIRPTREQVDSAVLKASLSLPKYKRKGFIDSMSMMLNYNAIERISVDAMISTYTLLELESMVEYYSKPEARSASKKVISWAKIVQPEIITMIDKALMRIKTGQ